MRQAATVPADHVAWVQYVMGPAIVNFTARGIRSGVLSADQYLSEYNTNMIRVTEAMLVTVFFGGLSLTARSRETKALAEMEHQAAKWVYRLAA